MPATISKKREKTFQLFELSDGKFYSNFQEDTGKLSNRQECKKNKNMRSEVN